MAELFGSASADHGDTFFRGTLIFYFFAIRTVTHLRHAELTFEAPEFDKDMGMTFVYEEGRGRCSSPTNLFAISGGRDRNLSLPASAAAFPSQNIVRTHACRSSM